MREARLSYPVHELLIVMRQKGHPPTCLSISDGQHSVDDILKQESHKYFVLIPFLLVARDGKVIMIF